MLSLVLVVGFIFVAAWVVRRMPLGMGRSSGPLKVLAALPLGPRERLVLVEARGEELLIAVSPAGVFNVGAAAQGTASAAGKAVAEPTFALPDPT
jgi:flagellar protein FliO/FliZ